MMKNRPFPMQALSRALLVPCLLAASMAASTAAGGGEAPLPHASLLHVMFQDHAVLQRGQPVRVWGQASPGQTVQVRFAGKRARGRADADGRWEVRLPALPAGGPHTLAASAGGVTQTVRDVLVGDVWLCSGQSNMELQVWRSLDARAEIANASAPTIRLLTVPKAGSPVPLETFAVPGRRGHGADTVDVEAMGELEAGFTPGRWQRTTPDTLRDFSAACYYFARELQKTVDVPMGLINAAWGGSRIQAWTSGDALRSTGEYGDALEALALYADDPIAAANRWGEAWSRWWNGRGDSRDAPWQADYSPGRDWSDAPAALGAWEQWGVPVLADYNGMVWYRATVALSAAQAAQDAVLGQAVLELGPADEMDMTWVNGVGVGSTYGAGDARSYPLPAGLLREGDNSIVVNVLDTWRDGGLAGPADAYALRLADGTRLPLGRWRYRAEPDAGEPPRAPWQSAAGLSTLYNGMIAPLGHYGLRGVLWYQGESNTSEGREYAELLRTLRGDWRARFGNDLPLLVVQLANYGPAPTAPGESDWARLRESQRQVAAEDANTGLAVTIDIGDRYDIHPPNKQELGRRLARVARHVVHGEEPSPSGPVPTKARREGDAVMVSFTDVSGGLVAYGAEGPVGFELCGATQGSCRYADAQIRGNDVVLRASVSEPARVRHGWADSPVVTLFDGAGLPAGPFEIGIEDQP